MDTRAGAVIVLAAALLVAATGSGPRAGGSSSGQEFRVATFNIHKGADRGNRYSLQRIIETIATFDARVVGLQEVMRNDAQLKCDDQPALIAEGLRRVTGRQWYYVYAPARSASTACAGRGSGDNVATEGVALFTSDTITESKRLHLVEDRVALMVRVKSLPDVPVIVTHLAAFPRNQAHRVAQLKALLPWARVIGAAVVLGDLNAPPESPELAPAHTSYRDAWAESKRRRTATGIASGETEIGAGWRIDYVFYDAAAPIELITAGVPDIRAADGATEPSDHRPVLATFRRLRAGNGSRD